MEQKYIQLYINQIKHNNKDVLSYRFHKNPALFRWLLGLFFFSYDRTCQLLYTEAREEITDLIEMLSKGRIRINKSGIHKQLVRKAIAEPERNTLPRFDLPKQDFKWRVTVKYCEFENKNWYLITTDDIIECKRIFTEPFINYQSRLSAFLIPCQEIYLLKLLKLSRGKVFISLHQHVKVESLFLRHFIWLQSYKAELEIPQDYLKKLKSKNYSMHTIQNYFHSFYCFLYFCKLKEADYKEVRPSEVNDYILEISTRNSYSTSTRHLMINAVLLQECFTKS